MPSTLAMRSAPRSTSCTVYLSGQVAQLTFSSQHYDVTPACQDWVISNLHSRAHWVIVASILEAPHPRDMATTCDLQTKDAKVFAVVSDRGNQTTGQQVCAQLLAARWVGRSAAGVPTST
jgi:hypothetical protein